jgi:hypothetical protein
VPTRLRACIKVVFQLDVDCRAVRFKRFDARCAINRRGPPTEGPECRPETIKADRRAYFGPETGYVDNPVIRRPALATPHPGPCIIEEYDATCVIPPAPEPRSTPSATS